MIRAGGFKNLALFNRLRLLTSLRDTRPVMGLVSFGVLYFERHQMKIKAIAEACMWLPGFSPEEDPNIASITAASISTVVHDPVFMAKAIAPVVNVLPEANIWPRLLPKTFESLNGVVTKYQANVDAISLLRVLETDQRNPTTRERDALNRYTGWGGLPHAFVLDDKDQSWSERARSLKEMLTAQEYGSASESTLNAHFTPIEVIDAMWEIVRGLGFTGGRVLEPAAGPGYFIGAMPEDLARKSVVTAIELDQISARINQKLYGAYGVATHQCGFESSMVPDNYFDVVIGNVPFGSYTVNERRNVPYANFSIHNYFLAKSLEVVRPGGIVAVITSSHTMDSTSEKVRCYLASQASLVGAIRLPNTTFKEMANTDVTSDILVFQKHERGQTAPESPQWITGTVLPKGSPLNGQQWYSSTQIWLNRFYAANPQFVIGKLETELRASRHVLACKFDGDLVEALAERVQMMPRNIMRARRQASKFVQANEETLKLDALTRPGYAIKDGRVYEINGLNAIPVQKTGRALDRLVGLINIRDSVRQLIAAQTATDDDALLSVYRTGLNVVYDSFIAKFGFIHEASNRKQFAADPDLPLMLALESWDSQSQRAEKSPIFSRRTAGTYKQVQRCENTLEALQVCLGESANINWMRISQLTGKPVDAVKQELVELGMVFQDPISEEWESRDEYLSGNVRKKLQIALAAGSRFEAHVEALKGVQPRWLNSSEITARIGSTWIPVAEYCNFLEETFKHKGFSVTFESKSGSWDVVAPYSAAFEVAAKQTFGTERMDAIRLFDMELNMRKPTVYDKGADGKTYANLKETIAAREKQQQLKEHFVQWLWASSDRRDRLTELYNEQFNSLVPRRFNGAHLVLPGMSQAYTLRAHQRDAIWRVISSSHNTLLAHAVGAGKTLEMVCSAMELRRLGVASKVMLVVPNHMLLQISQEFLLAYPNANILMASKDDLVGDKRRQLLARIATYDWDAVVVTQATFESIKVSDEHLEDFIQHELDEIEWCIRTHSSQSGRGIVKQLARAKKVWKQRLEKLSKSEKKDGILYFEDLGIDWLMIDEAHWCKNAYRFTKMDRIAGLPNSNSERSFDLLVKTRLVGEKRPDGRGITFATGTPISNTMAEMWTMMRFLQPQTLEEFMIENFDSWAANFGESVTALELAPDGNGYRMQTRFSKFTNLPELMSIFGLIADIRTADMLDLPKPKANAVTVTAEPSEALKEYVQTLVKRAEKIRSGGVRSNQDNMLKVTSDGRKAALDMRLVNPWGEVCEGGKIQLCAQNVYKIWDQFAEQRGTQLVFCDLSTPRDDGGFNAYACLRELLIERGIPSNEIAFIHDYNTDAEKASLFKEVREGIKRVLVGSTEKMGVGTNVQDLLVAVHHLDSPWRPSDLEQRNGRIVRQGNKFSEVWIYTYLTKGSFDAYMYQILHTKARFIAQVMHGNASMRTVEDAEVAALSYAEIKALASGNPMVLEKAAVDSELVRLSVMHSNWQQQREANLRELKDYPSRERAVQAHLVAVEKDCEAAIALQTSGFKAAVGGAVVKDVGSADKAFQQVFKSNLQPVLTLGSINGFLVLAKRGLSDSSAIHMRGEADYEVTNTRSGAGIANAVSAALESISQHLDRARERVARLARRKVDLETEITKPFERMDRLIELRKRQVEIESLLDVGRDDVAAVDESEQSEEATA